MKLQRFLAAGAMGLTLAAASAQITQISPVPQQLEWGTKAFNRPAALSLVGDKTADQDAVKALLKQFAAGKGVKVTIGERGDKAVKKYASKIPQKPEGYYLKVTPKEVVIAGNDERGTFYGVQTFLQVASSPEVMSVEITDWPVTPNRGVVEGFYGNAWSFNDRLSQYDFYGRNKLNTYIYGPKDDPYHRSKWRELYPAEEAARMKALNDAAKANKVNFIWGIHPAGDHKWNEADNLATIRKFQQMYDLGFRSFAIFFDDVFGEAADGKKHAAYMKYVKENFIDKHPDIENFIMCPSLYNKLWQGSFQPSYLEDISVMDPSIGVMWTGNSVVDMINVSDMEWINPKIGRKAFIWLNYPVSDYCINHLLMGPFWGNDAKATEMVSGFTANPMEYAEASKVSIFSNADFLWNPAAYDSDKSWELALSRLQPKNTEDFKTFCLYNIDLGRNTHNLRRTNESPDLKGIIDKYAYIMESGYSKDGAKAFRGEFDKLEQATGRLMANADGDALLTEIMPWIKATNLLAKRGRAVVDMYENLCNENAKNFIDSYTAYAALTDQASKIASRDFPGSIKTAYPAVGSLYAEPFMKTAVSKMIDIYKDNFDYRTDIFPVLPLENGNYRIRFNGKWLGNPDAGGKGGAPVWQDKEDDVNPDRQIWRLTYNPVAERYTIVNAKDGRYINERLGFQRVSRDGTPYPIDPIQHSFKLEKNANGSYTLRNSESDFVNVTDGKLKPSETDKIEIEFIKL